MHCRPIHEHVGHPGANRKLAVSTVNRARTVRHRLALAARRHTRTVAFAAVVWPGVLAGLSDDHPAGITT
jgi:hypothetical protein